MKISAFLLAAALLSQAAIANVIQGRVVGVADGDTITVLDSSNRQHRIRLAGIDAPEKAQAFGQRSKQSLSSMVYGKQVSVDWDKRDRYDRIIGRVSAQAGDVNLAQVRAGLAWHYKHYAGDQPAADRVSYARAESTARMEGRGLWADPSPVPPWEWRRR